MQVPHVSYSYELNKDIENIKIGIDTVRRGRNPDREILYIIEKYGENPTRQEIGAYLKTRWEEKDAILELIVSQLQEYWDSIERVFFIHLFDRMQLTSLQGIQNISGFFSTRYGCGYRLDERWFAVSIHNSTMRNTLTAMHEIMHIFFHKQWWKFCEEQRVPQKNIWDIKETTTVLLNLWFKNQLIDIDLGYEEHAELRHFIKEWFLENRNFQQTLIKACEYMKRHPEKSPNWVPS